MRKTTTGWIDFIASVYIIKSEIGYNLFGKLTNFIESNFSFLI